MSDAGVGGDKEIRALAEAVVDVLEERGLVAPPEPMPGRVLKVADVAKLLGRGRPWVYEHAAELGAFRFGSGPRARIGFDRDAIERWKRDRQILEPAATSASTRRRGRPPKNAGSSASNLIPYDPSPYRA
jgi:predicted DNA-binding transcriptional regulator AlpA